MEKVPPLTSEALGEKLYRAIKSFPRSERNKWVARMSETEAKLALDYATQFTLAASNLQDSPDPDHELWQVQIDVFKTTLNAHCDAIHKTSLETFKANARIHGAPCLLQVKATLQKNLHEACVQALLGSTHLDLQDTLGVLRTRVKRNKIMTNKFIVAVYNQVKSNNGATSKTRRYDVDEGVCGGYGL